LLSGHVEDGYITEDDAPDIAQKLLYDNPARFSRPHPKRVARVSRRVEKRLVTHPPKAVEKNKKNRR